MKSANEPTQMMSQPRNIIGQRLANLLFNPHPSITDITERRKAQLTVALSLVITLTNIIALFFVGSEGIDTTFFSQFGLTIMTFLGYLLSRTSRFVWGSIILVASLSLLGFTLVLAGSEDPTLSLYSSIPAALVIGSALLPVRGNVILFIGNLIGILALPALNPSYGFNDAGTDASLLVTVGILLIVVQIFRNNLEQARLTEIETINQELRELGGKLEQRVAARTKDLATVAEMGTATATILETDRLLQAVVDLTKERFNLYHSHIYLLDQAGENLVLASGAGEPGRQMKAKGLSIPLDREQSLVVRAARERKGVIVNDVTQAPDFLPNPMLPDTRSELAVPMIVGENVIGVFDVQSEQVGRFTDSDINIQTTLASQIAAAVQNARLYTQAETSKLEIQALVDYATEGLLVLDLETGLFTEPNESAAKLYGLPREELVKVGPAQMSPPSQPDGRDSTEKALEHIGEAMQSGAVIFEWMHRNAQGQDFLSEIRLVRLPGAHPRLRTTVTDITERRRIEELTRQRARQQEALNLITQKIQNATTVESALQVAVRELGHALSTQASVSLTQSDKRMANQ